MSLPLGAKRAGRRVGAANGPAVVLLAWGCLVTACSATPEAKAGAAAGLDSAATDSAAIAGDVPGAPPDTGDGGAGSDGPALVDAAPDSAVAVEVESGDAGDVSLTDGDAAPSEDVWAGADLAATGDGGDSASDTGSDTAADADPCGAGDCSAKGTCWPATSSHPSEPCQVCALDAAGVAAWVDAPTATTCTDGDACTQGEACADGACLAGAPVACQDGNPCTVDTCDPASGCVVTAAADNAPCSDGDACTAGDHCAAAACVKGTAVVCNDGAPCTQDKCDATVGCTATNLPASASCSDGDACTTEDHCLGGACAPGAAALCDDGNPCTADGCDLATGCTTANLDPSTECSDGDACTAGDHCVAGSCAAGAAKVCSDGNPCTADTCDAALGCGAVALPPSSTCSDGNACTGADHCQDGACQPGPAAVCNDGNPCTVDSCVPSSGCALANVASATACNDGDSCTSKDACAAGKCIGKPMDCNDDNPCTLDTCSGSQGCVWTPVPGSCDDANPCTYNDYCSVGFCTGTAKNCLADVAIPACVKASCANDGQCSYIPTNLGACRPIIQVTSPVRGAYLSQAEPKIAVTGKATGTIGKIASVSVNGAPATLAADGTFVASAPLQYGNNSLVVVAKDIYGSSARYVQAAQWSSNWSTPDAPLAPASALWLGAKALDSGVHNHAKPRDLATVFELAAAKIDFAAALPAPLYESTFGKATLTSATHDPPKVKLVPKAGYLQLTIEINSIIVKADAKTIGCLPFLGCQTITGVITATVTSVVTQAKLTPKVVAGQATLVVSGVSSKATGVDVTADNPTLMLAAADIKASLTTQLETGASAAISGIAPLLSQGIGSGLSAATPATVLSIPKPTGSGATEISISGGLFDMLATDGGLATALQMAATATPTIALTSPGVPLRQGCTAAPANFGLAGSADMEFAIWDDLINGALRALWLGGWFEGDLGTLFSGTPLEQLGITAQSSMLLPPVISDCPGPNATMTWGDLQLSMKGVHLGQPLTAIVHANIRAKVSVKWADGHLQLWLGAAEAIDVQCELDALKNSSNEEDMEKYMTVLYLPAMLEKLGAQPLLSLPAPVLDFSAAAGLATGEAVLALDAILAEHAAGVSRAAGPVKP